jgi:nitrite reductase/ring-hydroxylating ferredoxin subunit
VSDAAHAFDVALAHCDAIAPGGLLEVEARVDGEAESVILHRDAAGAVRAWRNVCPHAGRRLDWAPGQFLRGKDGGLVCAVHGASFELVEGRCVAGPCRGDRLRAVAVRCVDGQVRLGAPEAA